MRQEDSEQQLSRTVSWTICGPALVFAILLPTLVQAGQSQLGWSINAQNRYTNDRIHLNQTYRTVGDWRGQLDLYLPESAKPVPVVLFFHGGGWLGPRPKESRNLYLLPWLEMGYAVVNVDYRDGVMAKAPAMVEDARCALRWVVDHANEYRIDLGRIITTGESMGSWLALLTGMMPSSAGLDGCSGAPLPQAAAVIDWYGLTDVVAATGGRGAIRQTKALADWLDVPQRTFLSASVSPLTYVKAGAPPVMIIHGDADESIDYQHSVALDAALRAAGVEHEFLTVHGGGHGQFVDGEQRRTWSAVQSFLILHHLTP